MAFHPGHVVVGGALTNLWSFEGLYSLNITSHYPPWSVHKGTVARGGIFSTPKIPCGGVTTCFTLPPGVSSKAIGRRKNNFFSTEYQGVLLTLSVSIPGVSIVTSSCMAVKVMQDENSLKWISCSSCSHINYSKKADTGGMRVEGRILQGKKSAHFYPFFLRNIIRIRPNI